MLKIGKLSTGAKVLVGFLTLAGLIVLGGAFLFSGSEVGCEELEGGEGPAIRCEFEVAAPPGEVWTAFTGTEEPRPYYFDAILQAEMRPGGRWRFVTDDRERLLAGGEILEVDAPRRFAHTFVAADLDDPPSRITMTLEELSGGTRVTLVHDRFPRKTTTYKRFSKAHPIAMSALQAWVEDGKLPLRAKLYTLIFKPGMKTFTVRAEPW